jgi:hypothetical protein
MKSEAVVYALAENAAKGVVSFKDENIADACLVCRNRRRHTCRAATNHDKITLDRLYCAHFLASLVLDTLM